MSEDAYVLKYVAGEDILELLNETAEEEYQVVALMNAIEQSPTEKLDEVSDWIAALKSDKKIVNPISPKEEFNNLVDELNRYTLIRSVTMLDFVKRAISIAAKKHPDLEDWLSDRDD